VAVEGVLNANPAIPAGLLSEMDAAGREASAGQKMMAHDGKGCLADLDQADLSDPQGKPRRLELRARCEMRAGQCEAGKAHYREFRRAWHRKYDKTGLANDATLDHEVEQMAKAECATQEGGGKSLQNTTIGIVQQIVLASQRGDADACVKHGKALQKAGARDRIAAAGLSKAAQCAAKGGKCKEAKLLYLDSLRFLDADLEEDMREAAWKANVKECHE
jgi:hypothetical protein